MADMNIYVVLSSNILLFVISSARNIFFKTNVSFKFTWNKTTSLFYEKIIKQFVLRDVQFLVGGYFECDFLCEINPENTHTYL